MQRKIQRSLPSQIRKQSIRTFFFDNFSERIFVYWFDISNVPSVFFAASCMPVSNPFLSRLSVATMFPTFSAMCRYRPTEYQCYFFTSSFQLLRRLLL
ncbi:MAG: hypothetical protein PHI28_18835, partial [Mangrovibacterium sp.]|nr:hypothetical protein [Mangrovibacterium sp.]